MRATDLYRVAGDRVPSVTEILKLADVYGYVGISGDVLLRAARRGQEVHGWTELLDQGAVTESDEPDPEIQGYVQAYLRFKREAGLEVIATEQVVVSEEYRYAGTLDRIARLRFLRDPSTPIVLDIKCVALVQPSTRLQVAGYALAAGEKRRGSVQLKPDGKYRFAEYRDDDDVRDWLSCVRVAWFKLRHGLGTLED